LQSCVENTIENLVLKSIACFFSIKKQFLFRFLKFQTVKKKLVCKFSYVFREPTAAEASGGQAIGYVFKFCSY